MGRVPLARRNLLADRRRLAASVTGVGLAVMLILLLDGMWAGIRQQTTLYTDRTGAHHLFDLPAARHQGGGLRRRRRARRAGRTMVDHTRACPAGRRRDRRRVTPRRPSRHPRR